jgi:hypothetical protein
LSDITEDPFIGSLDTTFGEQAINTAQKVPTLHLCSDETINLFNSDVSEYVFTPFSVHRCCVPRCSPEGTELVLQELWHA